MYTYIEANTLFCLFVVMEYIVKKAGNHCLGKEILLWK